MPGRAKAAESASPDSRFFSGIRRFPERSEAPAEPSRITLHSTIVILSEVGASRTKSNHGCAQHCHPERSEAPAERSRRTPAELAAPPAYGEFPPPTQRTEVHATESAENSRQGSLRRAMYSLWVRGGR